MEWLECTVPAGRDPDSVCDALSALGVEGMSVEDEGEFRAFLENNREYWDYVDEELEARFAGVSRVKFWLPLDAGGEAQLRLVREAGFAPEVRPIADEDWENNWKQYYRPIPVGKKLVVVPAWEDVPADGRLPLRLDPGLIFGTGSHPTTRMCLEALEGVSAPDARVLDLGCGSGILSIGALVLGCREAVGCDIDDKAPYVAAENAALNGLGSDRCRFLAGNILTDRRLQKKLGTGYEIVLANIVSDVIIPLAPIARGFLAGGGVFITSGIIEGRQAEVRGALEAAGFRVDEHKAQEDWHCFVCRLA